MWRNYLTVALRVLDKQRLYALINVLGLALGLAGCLTILLYLQHELSYDRHVPEGERVYRVEATSYIPGREPERLGRLPGPAIPALTRFFPEIEAATRVLPSRPVVSTATGPEFLEVLYSDGSFTQLFPVVTLAGEPERALRERDAIALSLTQARRFFGPVSPVGRTLEIISYGIRAQYRVVGVYQDWPTSAHLQAPALMHLDALEFKRRKWMSDAWLEFSVAGYVKLRPGVDSDLLVERRAAFEATAMPTLQVAGRPMPVGDLVDFDLMPLRMIHLSALADPMRPDAEFATARPGAPMLAMFAMIAVMVLAVACINFMNLATARASQRAREVALRKVMGARRGRLVVQFLAESLLIAGLAVVLSLSLVELMLPTLNALLKTGIVLALERDHWLLLVCLALTTIVGLLGGLYPAIYLSGFRPARILKANQTLDIEGASQLRTALVVVQFAVAIFLIICTLVVYAQTWHARAVDPGYATQELIVVKNLNRKQITPQQYALADAMRGVPGVVDVALAATEFPDPHKENILVRRVDAGPDDGPLAFEVQKNDWNTMDALGVPLVAGRALAPTHAADDATMLSVQADTLDAAALAQRHFNVVVNETAAWELGFDSLEDAIGQELFVSGGPKAQLQVRVRIVGVYADVQLRSVREPVLPMIYARQGDLFYTMIVRFTGNSRTVMAGIADVWARTVRDVPFEAALVDEQLARQYDGEAAGARMFAAFAALAVLVACLGLYGLAAFATERRTREIGIRKIMGARVTDILGLLVWQLSKPVLLANLLAWPLAWYVMHHWLAQFTDRVALNPLWFVAAGAFALLFAWATVAGHAARIARASPIHALRYA